ncbi:hypothetical protein EDD86DRAFT_248625 [Gorgonomyces haynaldii]|nr:hypothetical protein EDD86DRAFT_248625 [Gorgonomyces haynaldii]
MAKGSTALLIETALNTAKPQDELKTIRDPTVPPVGTRPTYFTGISSAGFKSTKASLQKRLYDQKLGLRVFPEKVKIMDYEPGRDYTCEIKIQNCSKTLKRVFYMSPKTKAFELAPGTDLSQQAVTSGMSCNVTVVFRAPAEKDKKTRKLGVYRDSLVINVSGGSPLVIPLEAYPSAPRLLVEESLEFGIIILEHGLSKAEESLQFRRNLLVKNASNRDVSFKCVYDPKLLKVETKRNILFKAGTGPSDTELEIQLLPLVPGAFEAAIQLVCDPLEQEYTLPKITVRANVLKHRLSIEKPDGTPVEIRELDFGTVYFGQEAYVPFVIKNNGSKPVRWVITSSNQRIPYCPDTSNLSQRERRRLKQLEDEQRSNMFVDPMEGILESQQKQTVKFLFKPLGIKQNYGFKKGFKPVEFKNFVQMMKLQITKSVSAVCLSNDPAIDMTLAGQGCPVLATLSEQLVKFDQEFSRSIVLKNESKFLPFVFEFDKLAQFSIVPSKGTLEPNSSIEIEIQFRPNQIGNFDMTASALEAQLQRYQKLPQNKDFVLPTIRKSAQIDFIPPNQESQAEWMKKVEHRNLYIDYIRKSRLERIKKEYAESFGDFEEYSNASPPKITYVDGESGLVPPQPIDIQIKAKAKPPIHELFTMKRAALPIVGAYEEDAIDTVLSPADLEQVYTSLPVLDFGDISSHTLVKLEISFLNNIPSGNTIHLEMMSNNHGTHASVNIQPRSFLINQQRVAKFQVSCTVHTAGMFESHVTYVINKRHIYQIPVKARVLYMPIKASVHSLDFVCKPVNYMVAEQHGSNIDLAPERFVWKDFGDAEYCIPRFQQPLELINTGGCDIKFVLEQEKPKELDIFKYGNSEGVFSVEPHTGVIPANKSVLLTVSYIPGTKNAYETDLHFDIYDPFDGQDRLIQSLDIHCTAQGPDSQCSINLQRNILDFGVLPEFITSSNFAPLYDPNVTPFGATYFGKTPLYGAGTITIKNTGQSACNYIASLSDGSNHITLEDNYGLVPANGQADIHVTTNPTVIGVFEDEVVVNIVGGNKSFKIPVKCETQVPDIQLSAPLSVFQESVIVGSSTVQGYVIKNTGNVYARLILDMQNHKEFYIKTAMSFDPETEKYPPKAFFGNNHLSRYGVATVELDDSVFKNCNTVDILPGEQVLLEIEYRPVSVAVYDNPISLYCLGKNELWTLLNVNTRAIPSPVELSETDIVFEDVIIHSSALVQEQLTSTKTFVCKNVSSQAIRWRLEHGHPECFETNATSGLIEPNEKTEIQFKFTPTLAMKYTATGYLILELEEEIRFQLSLRGNGLNPSISFDPPELFMPVVPCGTTSTQVFYILNHGCELGEINAVIAQDMRRDGISLEIVFPEGCLLRPTGSRLPCIAKFTTIKKDKKPVSFTSRVQFCGVLPMSFYITVHGTSATCALTLQPYFYRTRQDARFELKDKRIELIGSTSQSFTTPLGIPIKSKHEAKEVSLFWQKTGETVLKWLSDHVLLESVAFPLNMSNTYGKSISDLVQSLLAKKLGLFWYTGNLPTEERVRDSYKQYQELLVYLISIGCLLGNVKPEFLMSFEDSKIYRSLNQEKGMISNQEQTVLDMYDNLIDNYFDLLAKEAWATVLLQILRMCAFPASKCRLWPITDYYEPESNIYGECELGLLNWARQHLSQETSDNLHDLTSMRDGQALRELIVYYCPRMSGVFDEPRKDPLENQRLVCKALKDIYGDNVIGKLDPQEMIQASALEYLLILLFLYETLPGFVPKATIDIQAHLHQHVSKTIELINSSTRSMTFICSLQGDPSFSLEDQIVTMQPRKEGQVRVEFKSCFTKQSKAQLILKSKRMGFNMSCILVYELEASVEESGPLKTIETSSPLYSLPPTILNLLVTNPFSVDACFVIHLQEDAVKPTIPPAFQLEKNQVFIKANASVEINCRFIPFTMETHSCIIHFLDTQVGEFTYKILGDVTDPQPSGTVLWTTNADTSVEKVLKIAPFNTLRDRALTLALSDFKRTSRDTSIDKSVYALPKRTLRYKVECSSEAFQCPNEILIRVPQKHKLNPEHFLTEMNGTGRHNCKIRLVCLEADDIRVYAIQGVVRSEGLIAELEFFASAREVIVQEVPIINNAEEDWIVRSLIQGSQFSCPMSVVCKAGVRTLIPITFAPKQQGDYHGCVVLTNNSTNQRYTYRLVGHAQDPLPEETIDIHLKAHEKQVLQIPVKNDTDKDCIYDVVTNAPFTYGEHFICVNAKQHQVYEFTVHPKKSFEGQYHIKFFKIERSVSEFEIKMNTITKSKVYSEILMCNPMAKPVEFEIVLEGKYLSEEEYRGKGAVMFVNQEIGEFWYGLSLFARPSALPDLPPLHSYNAGYLYRITDPFIELPPQPVKWVDPRILIRHEHTSRPHLESLLTHLQTLEPEAMVPLPVITTSTPPRIPVWQVNEFEEELDWDNSFIRCYSRQDGKRMRILDMVTSAREGRIEYGIKGTRHVAVIHNKDSETELELERVTPRIPWKEWMAHA